MTDFKYKKHVEDICRLRNEKRDRHDRFRLDANERLSPLPIALWEKFKKGLRQEDVLCYPETEKFYEKLANHLAMGVENLVLTTGVDGAIKNCFELFVNPGDGVIYPDPTFGMVDVYVKLFQAQPRKISFAEKSVSIDKIIQKIDDHVALVFLPNPNSPTGHYFQNADLESLMQACYKRQVALLIDEAYWGFSPGTAIDFIFKYENVAIARSFSKVFGLAGLRIGYLAASAKLASLLYKFRPMYEVNQLALKMASLVLDHFEEVFEYGKRTQEGRKFFVDSMRQRDLSAFSTKANFVYVDFKEQKDALLAYLRERGILVRGNYNLETFGNNVRFTVGPVEEMKRLISMIDEGIENVKNKSALG